MKNKETRYRILYFLLATLLVVGIIVLINNFRASDEESVISVGAVFIGEPTDRGWNQSHYEGILQACDKQSCRIFTEFRVPEEKEPLEDAVSTLVSKGCSCIFLTSYGYGQFLDDFAADYPKIAFYDVSAMGTEPNCMSFFARMYQVRYLTGIIAGTFSESNILGYVTSTPVPETIRSINAYAMGIRVANPRARLLVKYTGSWDDREKEEIAVKELAEAGADVITFHEDRPYAIDLADEIGLYTTGYNAVYGEYSNRLLTSADTNWDMLYERILNDFLSGRANFSKDYWLGLSEDAVSLHPYSDLVARELRDFVASEENRIKTWRDVFSGEIYDNNGVLRCRKDERISDEELFLMMDWYVEGVEIYE